MHPGCPSNGLVSVGSSLLFVILDGSASVALPGCSVQFMRGALRERCVSGRSGRSRQLHPPDLRRSVRIGFRWFGRCGVPGLCVSGRSGCECRGPTSSCRRPRSRRCSLNHGTPSAGRPNGPDEAERSTAPPGSRSAAAGTVSLDHGPGSGARWVPWGGRYAVRWSSPTRFSSEPVVVFRLPRP